MKLSDLRPCDACGGKVAPVFYLVRFSVVAFNPQSVNEVLGLTQYFQGALGLAEVFAPDPEVATVAMDSAEFKDLAVELFICSACYTRPIVLAELAEYRAKQK